MKTRVRISLEPDLDTQVKAAAKVLGISKSEFFRQAGREFLAKQGQGLLRAQA